MVVTCSTVGLQAYLAGVPVVSVECSVISKDAPFGDFGIARRVESLEGLETSLLSEISRLKAKPTKIVNANQPPLVSATRSVFNLAKQILHHHAAP